MFIICNGNSKNLHFILKEWDGGGNCFRKNIYSGITNELRKAYDLSDVNGYVNSQIIVYYPLFVYIAEQNA